MKTIKLNVGHFIYLGRSRTHQRRTSSVVVNPAVNAAVERMKLRRILHFMLRAVNRLVCAQGKEITRLVEVMK